MNSRIYGFFYSYITLGTIFYLIDVSVFNMIVLILLSILLLPVYSRFCRIRIYDFEESDSAIPYAIPISAIIINVVLFVILRSPLVIIPGILVVVIIYIFTVFDYLNEDSVPGIIKIKNKHIIDTIKMVEGFIIIKILLIISFHFFEVKNNNILFLWIVGLIFDLLSIINLKHKELYIILFQEGFDAAVPKNEKPVKAYIVVLFSTLISLFSVQNITIFPYMYIIQFFKWISGLSSDIEFDKPLPVQGEMPGTSSMGEITGEFLKGSSEPSYIIQLIFSIIEKGIITFVILLILYFIFYPLISPFLKKGGGKVTFKEYYRHILFWAVKLFRSVINGLKSLLKKGDLKVQLTDDIKKRYHSQFTSKGLNHHEKRKLRILVRYYLRVIKWADKKAGLKYEPSLCVNELFNNIITDDNRELLIIRKCFNQGFYSLERVSDEELKKLKDYIKVMIKG